MSSEKVLGGASDMDLNRKFEGILSKFTNLVKGYQPRIFVLDPDTGCLSYHLLDDSGRKDKLRGSQPLGGSICTPSEEDENTFHINFASGEQWKVKAISAKERQQWVNRIRACAYSESVVSSHLRENKPVTPPGSKSHFTNGEPSKELQTLSLSQSETRLDQSTNRDLKNSNVILLLFTYMRYTFYSTLFYYSHHFVVIFTLHISRLCCAVRG